MLLKEGLPYLDMSICRQETFHDWSVGLLACNAAEFTVDTKFVESLPINSSLRNLPHFPRSELQDILLIKSTQLFLSTFLLRFNSNMLVLFASFQSFPHFFSGTWGEELLHSTFWDFFCVFKAWHLGSLWWKSLVMGMGWHGYVPSSQGSQHFRNLEKTFSHHLVWFLISF